MTFSIIGFDARNKLIGSAVSSVWTGVGGCVQFFEPNVGFVNIQNKSHAAVAYRTLDNIARGMGVEDALGEALRADRARESRQAVVCSLGGGLHVYTGKKCMNARHLKGKTCAAAGNSLAAPQVVDAMVDAFESAHGEDLVERLFRALEAGQEAGGDLRGQEAAAIKVYRLTYPNQRFYPVDLRVDSHPDPLPELRRLCHVFGGSERKFLV